MKRSIRAAIAAASIAFIAACGAAGNDGQPSQASVAAPIAITSWQTWAMHFEGQVKTCVPGGPDECFAANDATMTEARAAILDNDLPLDDNASIAGPMQSYRDTYREFIQMGCNGASQLPTTDNVMCLVKREQLRTIASQVVDALTQLAG